MAARTQPLKAGRQTKSKPAAQSGARRRARSAAQSTLVITYANLSTALSDPRALRQYDRAYETVSAELGRSYPLLINGEPRAAIEETPKRTPINTDVILGYAAVGSIQDAQDAIAAARAAFPAWSALPWRRRVAMLRKVAALINKRLFTLSAWLSLDVGKSRAEALGDVKETADLIDYYCDQMEANAGFIRAMQPEETAQTRSILKPYGVWVVISPFNFPVALSGGPMGAALVAGNTVVLKPASDTPISTWHLAQCFLDAGLPPGVVNFVTGPGRTVGEELVSNPDVAGMTFTGSFEVGFNILKRFSIRYPRPCVAEMGGKNPVIVSNKADLNKAAEGVMRSAFGLSGQKCSAASRVYAHRQIKDQFVGILKQKTEALKIGDPTQAGVFTGPVINRTAYERYQQCVAQATQDGGEIVAGGYPLTEGELAKGFYCAPTIVDGLPRNHVLFKEELFLPFVVIGEYEELDEALREANDSVYGLTAGFYSRDRKEVQYFLNHIQAGVVYVNREKGATTGAWPGIQPFGGWKGSGSTSRGGGGVYYVQQYLREQSQTIWPG
ncbi:MAG: aldehyde dehydrogenase family protein [Anaerolineae bacterium]|nr:aldehyde dehydrogenase family protein [Thermoflexales bacterium]MDW8406811.1 aldehyde dehydrogenase family protein [Anaerolineae bacterium]